MARYRRRSSRRSRGSERRIEHRQWFTVSGREKQSWTTKAGADTDNVIKLLVAPFKGDDQTILRTRGFFEATFNDFGDSFVGALGGIVLPNKTAQNASTDELPNPLVDADTTDWFVWQPFYVVEDLGKTTGGDTGEVIEASQDLSVMIDSKAKRIMEASESAVFIIGLNTPDAVSSKDLEFSYCLRTLVGY